MNLKSSEISRRRNCVNFFCLMSPFYCQIDEQLVPVRLITKAWVHSLHCPWAATDWSYIYCLLTLLITPIADLPVTMISAGKVQFTADVCQEKGSNNALRLIGNQSALPYRVWLQCLSKQSDKGWHEPSMAGSQTHTNHCAISLSLFDWNTHRKPHYKYDKLSHLYWKICYVKSYITVTCYKVCYKSWWFHNLIPGGIWVTPEETYTSQ